MSMTEWIGRARWGASMATNRLKDGVETFSGAVSRYAPAMPTINVSAGTGSFLRLLGVGAACLVVGYGYGWWTTGSWWREQIALKSERVRLEVERQNDAIVADDAKILEALGDYDAQLEAIQNGYRDRLAALDRQRQLDGGRDACSVPINCLAPGRLREDGGGGNDQP